MISNFHPIILIGLEVPAALVTGFTDPVPFLRLTLFPFVAACCWRAINTCI